MIIITHLHKKKIGAILYRLSDLKKILKKNKKIVYKEKRQKKVNIVKEWKKMKLPCLNSETLCVSPRGVTSWFVWTWVTAEQYPTAICPLRLATICTYDDDYRLLYCCQLPYWVVNRYHKNALIVVFLFFNDTHRKSGEIFDIFCTINIHDKFIETSL